MYIVISVLSSLVLVLCALCVWLGRKRIKTAELEFKQHDKLEQQHLDNLKTLTERYDKLKADYLKLDGEYKEKEKSLQAALQVATSDVQNAAASGRQALENLGIEVNKLNAELARIKEDRDIKSAELKKIEADLLAVKPQLDSEWDALIQLRDTHRKIVLDEKGFKEGLWDLSLKDNESELISILERIKMDYPDLKTDIAAIEWKKIWLPKLQTMCSIYGLDGLRGVYRLVLKKDEKVCYVGQAVNIKDRWYQHVKKMIGVDVKGNEKLYDGYRPDDFWWSVIESGKDLKLNEKERFWIEYYCCKEIGLNKK